MRFNLVPVVLTTAAITAFAQEGDERPRRSLGARRLDHDNVNGGAHIEARALSAKAKAAAKKKAAAAAAKASASKKSASLKSKSLASVKSKSLASIASKSKSLASAASKASASSKSAAAAGNSAASAASSIASAKASLAAAQASFSSLASVQEAAIASASGAEKASALAASSSIAAAQAALSAKQTSVSGAALSVSSAASSISVASVSVQSAISSLSVASTSFTAAVGSITASIASATSSLAAQATSVGTADSCVDGSLLWRSNCVAACPAGYTATWGTAPTSTTKGVNGLCVFGNYANTVATGSFLTDITSCPTDTSVTPNVAYVLSSAGCVAKSSCTTSGVTNTANSFHSFTGTFCCADSQAASCDGPLITNSVTCTSPSVVTFNTLTKRTGVVVQPYDGTCAPSCPSGTIYFPKNAVLSTAGTNNGLSTSEPICSAATNCGVTPQNGACGIPYASAWTSAGVATACGPASSTVNSYLTTSGTCTTTPQIDCTNGYSTLLAGTSSGVCCTDPHGAGCVDASVTGSSIACQSDSLLVLASSTATAGSCQKLTNCPAGYSLSSTLAATCIPTSQCAGTSSTVDNGQAVTSSSYASWSVCCGANAKTCSSPSTALTCNTNYGLNGSGKCVTTSGSCNLQGGICCSDPAATSCKTVTTTGDTATACGKDSTGAQTYLTPTGTCVALASCPFPTAPSGPAFTSQTYQVTGSVNSAGNGICCGDFNAASCRATGTGQALSCLDQSLSAGVAPVSPAKYPVIVGAATNPSGTCSTTSYSAANTALTATTNVYTTGTCVTATSSNNQCPAKIGADTNSHPICCPAGALTCSSPTAATTCQNGFYLTATATCVTSDVCTNTNKGLPYTPSSGSAGICCYDQNALTCNSPAQYDSQTCATGFVLTPKLVAQGDTKTGPGTCASGCGVTQDTQATTSTNPTQYYFQKVAAVTGANPVAAYNWCVRAATCTGSSIGASGGSGYCCEDPNSKTCAGPGLNVAKTCDTANGYILTPNSVSYASGAPTVPVYNTLGSCALTCGKGATDSTQFYQLVGSTASTCVVAAVCPNVASSVSLTTGSGSSAVTTNNNGFCCQDANASGCDGLVAYASPYTAVSKSTGCKTVSTGTQYVLQKNSGANDGTCVAACTSGSADPTTHVCN